MLNQPQLSALATVQYAEQLHCGTLLIDLLMYFLSSKEENNCGFNVDLLKWKLILNIITSLLCEVTLLILFDWELVKRLVFGLKCCWNAGLLFEGLAMAAWLPNNNNLDLASKYKKEYRFVFLWSCIFWGFSS